VHLSPSEICFASAKASSIVFFGPFLGFYERIKPPLLPSPGLVTIPVSAINQFMAVQVRQAIGVSRIVPAIVAFWV
jgi:hypothetical protein